MNYDVITIGGGLGGSALGHCLAREGMRVLVLEREKAFKDRVRGEGLLPWGINEARDLGLYDVLAGPCGRPVYYWNSHSWKQRPPRDLRATTPRQSFCLNFYHPAMQQRLSEAAEAAGAEVRRGVAVRGIEAGPQPKVIAEYNGRTETIPARFVAGADGRGSRVREWLGFKPNRDPDCLVIAGVLLDGMKAPDTSVHVFRNSSQGIGALLFPLGNDRVRTYFIYRKRGERQGLSGNAKVPKFIAACIELGVPAEWLDGAEAAGPLAEFDGADTWIDRPYRDRVALIGDAASSNDPSWGNGLSLTLRDVRALRDALLARKDWHAAGHAYGAAHEQHFGVVRKVTRWLTNMLYEIGEEADVRRAKAFPLMQTDRSRSPDYIALGPETPHDEAARRRYFGEE